MLCGPETYCSLLEDWLICVAQDTDMPTISPVGCEEKCNDPVLVSVVKKHHGWITKVCNSC